MHGRLTLIALLSLCVFIAQGDTTDNKSNIPAVHATTSTSSPLSTTVSLDNTSKPSVINITINTPPTANAPPPPPPTLSDKNRGGKQYTPEKSSRKVQIPPVPSIDIVIDRTKINSPPVKKLFRLLGISKPVSVIHLVEDRRLARANLHDGIIYIRTRSFLNVLNFLSNAVETPLEWKKSGLVVNPKLRDGSYFNKQILTTGLLTIHSSRTPPKCNAKATLFYRGYWFYLADNDFASKRTLAWLIELINLQETHTPSQTRPVLTLPLR